MPTNAEIQIRDPFVVTAPEERAYYLFGSTDPNIWNGPGLGFDYYRGTDLEHWEGPFPAFRPTPDFWGKECFWAPEAHCYQGHWFLFATFFAPGCSRGTMILAADRLTGPYRPHSDGPVTPRDWMCLDGTLYVDEDGQPWMVFCHEWMQVKNGEICAIPLTPDLRAAAGDPVLLFHAADAPWVHAYPSEGNYVTDGPFMYRARNGELLMLWSSFQNNAYAQGVARSASGRVTGPWHHDPEPLYVGDGGHGMLFRRLDGQLMLALHSPNNTPLERPHFLPVIEEQGILRVR